MIELIEKASVLVEALPYIQEFRGAVVVVKFGGSAMEDPELIESVIRDVVIMECIGMRPVIVHGGGKAISARLEKMGIPVKRTGGMRHTCDATIEVVDDVLHNEVNQNLLNLMGKLKGKGQRISGKDILKATKMFVKDPDSGDDIDVGYVGNVSDVDAGHILEVIDNCEIPIIAPLAKDDQGNTYNINADIAAAKVAEALQARKLVFLSDVPGLLMDPKDESTLIHSIKINEVEEYIGKGIIAGGMLPKVLSAVEALKAGTRKVHMIDGRMSHSVLLELFTDQGVGTEIIND
ncbi:MAG: acetylglutamate kinase [Lentisphaeraceae bacterium]|nr:acetylglutamate kinase [Lentisphaeraceae bacterium]